MEKIYCVAKENGESIGEIRFRGMELPSRTKILDRNFTRFLIRMFDREESYRYFSFAYSHKHFSRWTKIQDLANQVRCEMQFGGYADFKKTKLTFKDDKFYLQYNGKKIELKLFFGSNQDNAKRIYKELVG